MKSKNTENWHLKLYVSSDEIKTQRAIRVLDEIIKEHLKGNCEFEVIDVRKDPQAAVTGNILATPSLIREIPPPIRRIVGDLSNKQRLLIGLEIVVDKSDGF